MPRKASGSPSSRNAPTSIAETDQACAEPNGSGTSTTIREKERRHCAKDRSTLHADGPNPLPQSGVASGQSLSTLGCICSAPSVCKIIHAERRRDLVELV
jgi:hypothetical protein